ncbi:JAB domain-containing protein [Reichenbachiella agariperforans]|uniref:JAB domain-containing protein n=1 Tax=Reichenbachiella agariperforans TaxID=156994 RepID=UPI001C0A33D5|nr:JAB domain-containing protein [Reichenbachiella agariperforans]MBU2915956.1 JAB domain-containing protein [Reichenbachiella agariperforans]
MKIEINTMKRVAEISAKYEVKEEQKLGKVTYSGHAYEFAKEVFPVDLQHREALISIYLNRSNEILGYTVISLGGVSGTMADPKLVFQHALLCNASQFIIAHNHPSGNLEPSGHDLSLTQKLKLAGKLMDLPMIDHLILTTEGYKSFADEGLL